MHQMGTFSEKCISQIAHSENGGLIYLFFLCQGQVSVGAEDRFSSLSNPRNSWCIGAKPSQIKIRLKIGRQQAHERHVIHVDQFCDMFGVRAIKKPRREVFSEQWTVKKNSMDSA